MTNINFSKCLKEATDFGVTHVHNVCDGTVVNVPWGSADWAAAGGLVVLGALAIAMFSLICVGIARTV